MTGQDALPCCPPATTPFLHIQVAVDEADFAKWALEDFGTDRRGKVRGVVEVEL